MHSIGKKLTVDVATWSPIWNYTLLAGAKHIDSIKTMSTYTANYSEFIIQLERAAAAIPLERLSIGLETDVNITVDDLDARFRELTARGIEEVALWLSPVPATWIPALQRWTNALTLSG